MDWRVAKSLLTLESEVRAVYPAYTYGTIGDAAHQAETSDHDPNAVGVVCALDIMCDGLNVPLARQIAASGHPDLKYVIHNRKIWSKARATAGWRTYTGSDPHTDHIHVSVGVGSDGKSQPPYDDTAPWGITTGGTTVSNLGDRTIKLGDQGPDVFQLRIGLVHLGNLASLGTGSVSGTFDGDVDAAVRAFQGAHGLTVDGVVGPKTTAAIAAAIAAQPAPTPVPAPVQQPAAVDLTPALDAIRALGDELTAQGAAIAALRKHLGDN